MISRQDAKSAKTDCMEDVQAARRLGRHGGFFRARLLEHRTERLGRHDAKNAKKDWIVEIHAAWRTWRLGGYTYLLFFITAIFASPAALAEDSTPIPELKRWEENMLKYGEMHRDERDKGIMPEQFVYYYDGEWVYFQIADYTGDKKWIEYAHNCQETYRTHVIDTFAKGEKVPGHRVHPHGLYEDYVRFKDEKSKEALMLLATKTIWSPGTWIDGSTPDPGACRECGYMLMTMLLVEKLGVPMPRIEPAVANGIKQLEAFCKDKTAKVIQPFMPALECAGLIQYAEQHPGGDKTILPTLVLFADWLWEQCWVEKDKAFCYLREQPNDPSTAPKDGAADLNLLIAPLYAWLYKKTGEVRFRERGDQAFAGGVKGAWLEKGKSFSQNYRWSFSYVKWRREGPEKQAAPKTAALPEAKSTATLAAAAKTEGAGGVPAAPAAPALDGAPYRAALVAGLKKLGKAKRGTTAWIKSLNGEAALSSFAEDGPRILVGSNEMPLRWKDLTDEDVARLGAACFEDAESLFNAGALATAAGQTALREKLAERLLAVDAGKAGELLKMK